MTHSTYTAHVSDTFILVEDQDQGMSVTNDAENMIADLGTKIPLAGRRVLYRDTEGRWDELLVKDGRFAGFKAIGATGTWIEAISAAKRNGR